MPHKECQKQIRYRAVHTINISKLKADLLLSNLFTNPAKNAHSLYHQYHTTVSHLLDKHAPVKTKKKYFWDKIECNRFSQGKTTEKETRENVAKL
jgi:hypothetical protein